MGPLKCHQGKMVLLSILTLLLALLLTHLSTVIFSSSSTHLATATYKTVGVQNWAKSWYWKMMGRKCENVNAVQWKSSVSSSHLLIQSSGVSLFLSHMYVVSWYTSADSVYITWHPPFSHPRPIIHAAAASAAVAATGCADLFLWQPGNHHHLANRACDL